MKKPTVAAGRKRCHTRKNKEKELRDGALFRTHCAAGETRRFE